MNNSQEHAAVSGVMDLHASAHPDSKTHQTANKLLFSREEAAEALSISVRSLDYLIAEKQLPTRRIRSRVLIQAADLRRFARGDHPARRN